MRQTRVVDNRKVSQSNRFSSRITEIDYAIGYTADGV